MNKVLMILTSHRLDCLRLALDCHVWANSFAAFDRVVFLLNGVTPRHRAYVDRFIATHPQVAWDTVSGPRGRNERISSLENECVRKYPDHLYVKADEDVFVSPGWIQKMLAAYATFERDDQLGLMAPIMPNNGSGFYFLLLQFPALHQEYAKRFAQPASRDCDGPVWKYPQIAEWITRNFIDLRAANARIEAIRDLTPVKFTYRFSVCCVLFDYRHWQQMGGIPKEDEPTWTQWVKDHDKFNVLVTNTLVNHYSFFVQQDWLDRGSLLEDLRRINLPDTLPHKSIAGYHLPRWRRTAMQIPAYIKRRLQAG
ncbi:MAG: hypothetical protein V1929_05190 [bacterium]